MLRLTALPLGDWHRIGGNTEKIITRNKLFILVLSFPQSCSCPCAALALGPEPTDTFKQRNQSAAGAHRQHLHLAGQPQRPGKALGTSASGSAGLGLRPWQGSVPGFGRDGLCLPFCVCQVCTGSACNTLISAHHKSLGWYITYLSWQTAVWKELRCRSKGITFFFPAWLHPTDDFFPSSSQEEHPISGFGPGFICCISLCSQFP